MPRLLTHDPVLCSRSYVHWSIWFCRQLAYRTCRRQPGESGCAEASLGWKMLEVPFEHYYARCPAKNGETYHEYPRIFWIFYAKGSGLLYFLARYLKLSAFFRSAHENSAIPPWRRAETQTSSPTGSSRRLGSCTSSIVQLMCQNHIK